MYNFLFTFSDTYGLMMAGLWYTYVFVNCNWVDTRWQ